MQTISIKRIYEAPAPEDGFRLLVDRVWPRGMTKEKAAIDLWDKGIAPSSELRKWFNHEPAKWDAFQMKYRVELATKEDALKRLLEASAGKPITLLYGAKDEQHNQAIVLRDFLKRAM
ncbi:DUF488 domain-containing protein [Brucella pseudogrignonensis]|uniref:DUF488 domain-containing protein n=1 Tax=Brucella pseudogrignonensis TaxID=419475 RepID=UPI0028B6A42C|nr:DUF488 domain-containing protein [Brucella pseudogrignonensis]MDT6941578.1 DUF488 domain-containing protein [Brucella pseudogrignonensis]